MNTTTPAATTGPKMKVMACGRCHRHTSHDRTAAGWYCRTCGETQPC